MFDLGRVDVHAARDDHVRRAVAHVQVAVRVEVAHVAERDQAVALDLAACFVVAAVGEIGIGGLVAVDQADLSSGARRAVFTQDAHARVAHRAAGAAGAGGRVARVHHGDHAGLARRIRFIDDGAEPVDHLALDLRRARCPGGGHKAQRRQVVLAAFFVGQLEQAHIHDGHEVDGVDAVALDLLQHAQRIKACVHYQQFRHLRGLLCEEAGRAVIERRRHQRAAARHDTERGRHHGTRLLQVRVELIERHGLTHDALGPARGARGIGHVPARRYQRPVVRRLQRKPVGIAVGTVGAFCIHAQQLHVGR